MDTPCWLLSPRTAPSMAAASTPGPTLQPATCGRRRTSSRQGSFRLVPLGSRLCWTRDERPVPLGASFAQSQNKQCVHVSCYRLQSEAVLRSCMRGNGCGPGNQVLAGPPVIPRPLAPCLATQCTLYRTSCTSTACRTSPLWPWASLRALPLLSRWGGLAGCPATGQERGQPAAVAHGAVLHVFQL